MHQPVGQGTRGWTDEFGGLRLTESHHVAGGRLDWHEHREGCVTLLLGGGMRESFRTSDVGCRRGDVVVKPPEVRHRTRFGSNGAHCLIVEVVSRAMSPVRGCDSLFERVATHSADPSLARRVVAELALGDSASGVVLEGIALQLLGLTARATSPVSRERTTPRWLSEVHERVHSEYLDRLTIAGLAEAAGVHPDHLGRAYRGRYGTSIGDAIRDLRLSWAAE